MSTSQNGCCQYLCPCSEPQLPPASAGDPPILAARSGPFTYGVTAFFPLGPGAYKSGVCPPRVEFLFSPVLWKSYSQIPLALKARLSGDSSSRCWTRRLGSLTWGSELSLQWENFCGIIVFQFVGCLPSGYGI